MTYVQNRPTILNMGTQATPTGQALRGLRKVAGLTLAEVSEIAGTAPAYLSKVESGVLTPSPDYFWRVAGAITGSMTAAAAAA